MLHTRIIFVYCRLYVALANLGRWQIRMNEFIPRPWVSHNSKISAVHKLDLYSPGCNIMTVFSFVFGIGFLNTFTPSLFFLQPWLRCSFSTLIDYQNSVLKLSYINITDAAISARFVNVYSRFLSCSYAITQFLLIVCPRMQIFYVVALKIKFQTARLYILLPNPRNLHPRHRFPKMPHTFYT